MLQRWKQAVIHIEGAADSVDFRDHHKNFHEQEALYRSGQISEEEFSKRIERRSRDIRCQGTALFLTHAGRRYLLTARHVVWNATQAERDYQRDIDFASRWPLSMRHVLHQSAQNAYKDNIFNMIFRIPTIDEIEAQLEGPKYLMNLGSGGNSAPFTFSSPELDLAIISLDQRDQAFAEELLERGFKPVSSEDIDDGPETEGQDVFTVGFPAATAIIGEVSQDRTTAHWSSRFYSLPVASFGRVSMFHEKLYYFWSDMSIYPGNSGGPLIAGDRLIGIVSAQAFIPVENLPGANTRIPFARIIKAKFIRDLLIKQEENDSW